MKSINMSEMVSISAGAAPPASKCWAGGVLTVATLGLFLLSDSNRAVMKACWDS